MSIMAHFTATVILDIARFTSSLGGIVFPTYRYIYGITSAGTTDRTRSSSSSSAFVIPRIRPPQSNSHPAICRPGGYMYAASTGLGMSVLWLHCNAAWRRRRTLVVSTSLHASINASKPPGLHSVHLRPMEAN